MKTPRKQKDTIPHRICLDGEKIALDIKHRAKSLKITVRAICLEAGVSYRTYLSWRSYGCNPSFASLRPIYEALDKREADLG